MVEQMSATTKHTYQTDDRPRVSVPFCTSPCLLLTLHALFLSPSVPQIHLIVESPATDSYVRNPVDEGFYDPTRTDVSLWNLDKLIARLTREDRKQEVYFEGADRHLKMEGYPIHEMIMRAANTELYADEPLLHTRIQPPAPYTGKDHWYDFKIQLNWIQFIEHALFTREDKLCRDLDDLCAEYKRRDTINLVSHYDSKIRGLRSLLQSQTYDSANFERQQLLKQQADPTAPIDQYTRMMHQQKQLDTLLLIREAIDMRDREEHEQRTLFKHIYAKWMDVRATRSEVTREMKAKGFWQNELQPVASARSAPVSVASSPTNAAAPPATAPEAPPPPGHTPREEAPIASPSAALASPSDTGVIGYPGYTLANPQPAAPASSGPPPGLRPLDVSSPMATQQLVLDTPAGVAASEQAAARLALLNASRPEFSPPPPPPPPPPEMPPPNNEPLITEQMKREQAALNPSPSPSPTNAQSQPHDAAYLAQQQQLNAQWQSMTPEQQQAWIQQQQQYQQQMYDPTYMQQQHAYYQQQQLAYQHFLAQQQSQSPTNADLKPNEEQKEQPPQPTTMNALPISSPHAIGLPSAANKKGRHVTLADTLAQERERTERERVESASDAANRSLRIDPNAAASQPIGDSDAVSTRAGDLALEKRAGLLKETYVGYPSNFKVGRHQLDWKHKPEDQIVYRQEKAAWVDAIKAELRETKLRLKLERCLKNGGVDPQEPLTPEQQQQRDQELYDAIEKRMSTMRRRPGGTKYLPVYNEDIKVFDTSRCLLEEQARRKMIEGYKVFLRVYVNGMRVCDTEPQLMSFPRFKVHFDTTIPLSLVAMPSSINVQVYHSRGLLSSDELLGEVGLPVPEFGAPVSFQEYTFSGAHIDPESAVMKHTPTPKDPFGPSRYVTAIIEAGVAWGKDVAQAPESMSNILSSFAENDRPRLAMRNKMNAMPGKKNIDPNDPRNADMLEHMHRSTMLGHKKKHTFVATESQVEGRLTDPKYHQSSARSLVLAARNDSGFIRDPVPLKDEEISSQLYSYIRIRDEADESEWEKYQATHKIDTELLYEREQARAQAKILNVSHDIHDVAEVVNERDLPVFSVNTSWLNTLFEKRRDLRPKRETHRIMAAPKSCNIVVQVVKGQNMPVRRVDGMTRNKAQVGNSSTMTLEQQEYVRTFVEISFQDSCKRTSCSRGTNPRWDQLISLPFRPPAQSFSPAHLSTCNDMVNFNVFDEITTSNEVDPRLTRTRLMHSEQRWLGSFSIPFTTIYHNGRIDGAFSINVPPHLLGYEQPHADRDAFLFIYATLDPVLTTPPPRPDRFHYMNPFYARAIEWVSELKARSPAMSKRAFMSVAGDISSNPQFLCRYITAERPPDKYQAPNVFTRFVSIIPFQDDAQASLGTVKDIWCTSKDFMALQGGDWEEHAILLNNYFTWYDANMADSGAKHHNYVALGEGSVQTTHTQPLRQQQEPI